VGKAHCGTTGYRNGTEKIGGNSPALFGFPRFHSSNCGTLRSVVVCHMKAVTQAFHLRTSGKGTYEITSQVGRIVAESGIRTGLATVFVQHTSASLIIYENADPSARVDLHEFFERLVPEDSDYFVHTAEGPDDMPSHIRMVLTRTSESVPIANGALQLGTWQGIFLFEHRSAPHSRHIVVSVLGT
jgi:secondary thiamine-phosphate synthase enzyme